MAAEFEVRGDGAVIRVSILGYERPDAQDYDDGNWLNASVHIAISGFRAEFPYAARASDLANFLSELSALYSSMRGTAKYHSLEEDIILDGRIDEIGGIEWSCVAQHPHGIGAKLEFRFRADQSYLPDLVSQLTEVLSKYPVRGRPGADAAR